MASELLRIRVRADAGNTQGVLSDVSRSLLGLSVGAAGARSGMLGMAAALGGAQITGRLASAAIGALGFSVYSAAGSIMSATGEIEQFRVNLNALVKDKSLVDAMVASIEGFASRTAFANSSIFEVAQNLVAARVPLQNLLPTLQMLGDVSLGNAEKFSGIATAWTQIISKGKITAEEINQIAERGVSVWAILAEETGKSVPELQKLAETGKLTVQSFLPILQAGLAKRYAGSLEEASKLSTNLAGNITKSVSTFAAVIGGGLESTVNPFMAELARLFQRAALYARALVASQIWQRFTQSLQAAADALMPIIRALGASVFVGAMRAVEALTPVMWLLAVAFRGISSAAQALFRYFKPLFDMFGRLATTIKSLNWRGLWTSIKEQSPDIASRIGKILLELVKAAILWAQEDMVPTLRAFVRKMMDDIIQQVEEHPKEAFAVAVGAWIVGALPGIIAAARAAGAGAVILGALVGSLDVKAGLEKGDWDQVAKGLVEILAGVIVARAKGGIFGFAASVLAGAIYEDVSDAINKQGEERSKAIWKVFSEVFFAATILVPWPALARAALTPLYNGLAAALTWVYVSFVALLPAWTASIAFATMTAIQSAFLLAVSTPALGLLILTAIGLILLRFAKGIRESNWVDIGSALLAGLALGIAIFIGGIPALFIGAIAAIILALFGPDMWNGLVQGFNNAWEYFANASEETLMTWAKGLGVAIMAGIGALATVILLGASAPIIAMGTIAGLLIGGLVAGLVFAWDEITTWLSEAWTSFVQWIKDFLGIKSPSTVMMEIGNDIIKGLWQGLEDTWTSITTWLEGFWTTIKELFNTYVIDLGVATKEYITALWPKIVAAFYDMWNNAVDGVSAVWTGITNWIKSQIDSIGETIRSMSSSVGNSLFDMFNSAWDGVKGKIQSIIDAAKSMISSAFSGASSGGGNNQTKAEARIARENYYKNMGDSPAEAARKATLDGFATGGQFTVGGSGGPDSQLVAFRATPGENVKITRPGQQSGINIGTINVYANDYQGGMDAARAIRDALGMQRQMLFLTT